MHLPPRAQMASGDEGQMALTGVPLSGLELLSAAVEVQGQDTEPEG
jgi:hypothetical protein